MQPLRSRACPSSPPTRVRADATAEVNTLNKELLTLAPRLPVQMDRSAHVGPSLSTPAHGQPGARNRSLPHGNPRLDPGRSFARLDQLDLSRLQPGPRRRGVD